MKYLAKPRLNEILKEKGIKTQKEMAELAGVTEATISRFSRQSRYEISTLIAISRALDLKIEDLFHIEETPDAE